MRSSILVGVAVVAIVASGIVGYKMYNNHAVKVTAAQAQLEAKKAEAEALKKTEELAKKAELNTYIAKNKEVFLQNIKAWLKNPKVRGEALVKLMPKYEEVVEVLIKDFASSDDLVVTEAGINIWAIAGDKASSIVQKYVTDDNVTVAYNAKWWLVKYSPGAIMDKIVGKEPELEVVQLPAEVPVETMKVFKSQKHKPALSPEKARDLAELEEDIIDLQQKMRSCERGVAVCRSAARKGYFDGQVRQANKDAERNKDHVEKYRAQIEVKLAEKRVLLGE